MALKDLKPTMYCTVLDVIMQSGDILTDQLNLKIFDSSQDPIVRFAHQVEHDIVQATNMVKSCLSAIYTESGLEMTPYAGIPFRDVSQSNLDDKSSPYLSAAEAGLLAITEWWTLTFSSNTNYAAKGSASELQGSSTISLDFISAGDGDLKILALENPNTWIGTFTTSEKFYIATYKHKPVVVSVTAMLALAYALKHIFTAELPNLSDYAKDLENTAMKWLDDLSEPYKSGKTLDGSVPARDFSDIQLPYIELIDVTGAGPFLGDLADYDYDGYEN